MSRYIQSLIKQGEHQQLDFKHSITDSKKIARSLAAFANTDGGTLLIGVKDNGRIAGINSDEEYYMVEAAAQMYCKPAINFDVTKWDVEGKSILEVKVKSSSKRPHKAPDTKGEYKAYIRVNDENLLASAIQVKIWKAENRKQALTLSLSEKEQALLEYLRQHSTITTNQFAKVAFIPTSEAERTLINLTVLNLISFNEVEQRFEVKEAILNTLF